MDNRNEPESQDLGDEIAYGKDTDDEPISGLVNKESSGKKQSMSGEKAGRSRRPVKRTALVVTGMHRSGTSALARVLGLLGADLPQNLLPPQADNPAGFWEPLELVTLHDEMLGAVGSTWDDIGPVPKFWESNQFVLPYVKRIAERIEEEYDDSTLFVIKDPRIARFVPVTIAALRELSVEPKFLIAVRNPVEVASSLKKRNGFHFAKSLLLWLEHTLSVERSTRGLNRTFVLYDRLVMDWRGTVQAACNNLTLSLPAWSSQNDAEIEAFVSHALRHHISAPEDLAIREDVAEWVKVTFETVRLLAQEEKNQQLRRLDRVYDEMSAAQTAFGPLLAQQRLSVGQLTQERDVARRDAVEHSKEGERLAGELEQARARGDEQHRAIERLSGVVEQLSSELEQARARAEEKHRATEKLSKTLERARAASARRQRERARLVRKLTAARAQGAALQERIERLLASRSWRLTKPLRAASRALRWLLRNTRRAMLLVWWLVTGQFSRAANASLPYYRRRVPASVRKMIPSGIRRMMKRKLFRDSPSNATNKKAATKGKRKSRSTNKINYAEWIARNDTLSDHDRTLIREHMATFRITPKFSILMPVYNTPTRFLRQAIDSVVGQLYGNWELCVADDASTSAEIQGILEQYAEDDTRIKAFFRDTNGGISACTNTALQMASGDWIVLLDHDDALAEHALYLVAEAINLHPDLAIIYSDEDQIDAEDRRSPPYCKPDWDYDLFLGQNLINHLGVYRADLARKVGGFREGFEGSQDWDFALRVLETSPNAKVHHIPFILYHWRRTDDTFSRTSLTRAVDSAQQAVNEHFKRTEQAAAASSVGHSSHLRIRRDLPAEPPLVSIVIPTKDQCKLLQSCIDSVLNRSNYKPIEIVIVDNGSSDADALVYLGEIDSLENVKVVKDPGSFNFSRLVNRGVAESSGDVVVLLNNDVEVINPGWLEELVSHALRPEVGAVGAKLYYGNDTVQHGGVVLGIGGLAGHAHRHAPRKSAGYFNRLNLTQNFSCVTAACCATRRDVYNAVGGFNSKDLAVSFNDVDFCIRIRQAGYRIIWTPNAELYHYESVSRGSPSATQEGTTRNKAEYAYMRKEWAQILDNDPFYNPNLSLKSEAFRLGESTRVRKPWLESAARHQAPRVPQLKSRNAAPGTDASGAPSAEGKPYTVRRLSSKRRSSEYTRVLLVGHSAAGKSRLATLAGLDRDTCDFDRYMLNRSGDLRDIFVKFLSSESRFLIAPNRKDLLSQLIDRTTDGLENVAVVYLCRPKDVIRENLTRMNEDDLRHPEMSEAQFDNYYADYDKLYRRSADYVFEYKGRCIDDVTFEFVALADELKRTNTSSLDAVDKINDFHEYLGVRAKWEEGGEGPPLLSAEKMKQITAGGYQVFDASVFPPAPIAGSIAKKKLQDLQWTAEEFGGMTVAEIGSQLGFFGFVAASLGARRVIGTDINSNFVAEANKFAIHYKRMCGWQDDRVMFRTQQLEVGDSIVGHPDIVVANSIIHWFIIQRETCTIEEVLCWLRDNCNFALYFEGCVSASEKIMQDHGVSLERYSEERFLEACSRVFRKQHVVGRCSYNEKRIVARLYK